RALELPVLDLHLLVDPAVHLRTRPLARDHERSLVEDHMHGGGIDARELDEHGELVRVVGVVAIDVRPEAAPLAEEARHLPELGEELLDLFLQPVDVSPRHGSRSIPATVVAWPAGHVLSFVTAALCSSRGASF